MTDTGPSPDAALDQGTSDTASDTVSAGDAAVKTAAINGDGGTLTSADGKVTLTVPAGALTKSVTFAIFQTKSSPSGNIGPAYEITPSGTVFAKAATLTITYDPAALGSTQEDTGAATGRSPLTLHYCRGWGPPVPG